MSNATKISEFTSRARAALAKAANENNPPATAEAIRKLMAAVLGPIDRLAISVITGDQPLNGIELQGLHQAIDWKAYEFGVTSRLIQLAVEIAFEVDDLAELRGRDFHAAMSYLVYLPGGDELPASSPELFHGKARS